MSANVSYAVEIQFLQSGNLAGLTGAVSHAREIDRSFKTAKSSWGSLKSSLGDVGSHLGSSLGGAITSVWDTMIDGGITAAKIAGAGMAAALGGALREGFKFSDYIEQSTIGGASVRAMLGGEDMDRAMQHSAASIERLRVLAKDLPGSMQDVVNTFSYIQPATIGMGIDDKRAENLAAHGVAAAAAIGVNQATFGHELAAAIEGRASSRMPAVAKLGFHAKELNAMDPGKRFDEVEKRILKLGPAIEIYKQSWAGLTSTAIDSARQTARVFSAPLFASAKSELSKALDWFGKNEDGVNAWATRLGVQVDYAFHRGLDAIKHWFPIVRDFGSHLYDALSGAFDRVRPYLERFEAMAEKFMRDPNAPHKLAQGAALVGGARLGVSGVEAFAGLAESAGLATGPLALVAALLGVEVVGAVHSLTDSTSMFHDAALTHAADIKTRTGELAKTFDHLLDKSWPLIDFLGTNLLQSIDLGITAITKWGEALDRYTSWIDKQLGIMKKDDPTIHVDREPFSPMSLHFTNTTADELAKLEKPKVPNHTVHIHGGINLRVEGNDDPTRVARRAVDMIKREIAQPSAMRSNPDARFTR